MIPLAVAIAVLYALWFVLGLWVGYCIGTGR